jgi:hypothetical protein
VLRFTSALVGTAAWLRLWTSPPTESPQTVFLLWLAAVLFWALALFKRWPLARPSRTTLMSGAIIVVALLPRLWSLSFAPYFVAFDEVIEPYTGIAALRAHPWEILSGAARDYFDQPYLLSILQAWPCLWFEPLFGSRFASVVLSVVSLVTTYALARRLFGKVTAVVALTLLAFSYWHMLYSRLAHPYMQPIALLSAAFYVLALGFDKRNAFLLFVGGTLLGISPLVYTPARIVVPLSAVWLLHRVITTRTPWRAIAAGAAAITLGLLIAYTPHLHALGTTGLLARFRGTAGPLTRMGETGWTSPEAWRLLTTQLQEATFPYYRAGGLLAVHDFSGAPWLDRVSLTLAGLGCCIALLRLTDSHCFLVVAWIAATFVFGQVFTDVPEAAYRAAPLLPALAIAAGIGVQALLRTARRWPPMRSQGVLVIGWLLLVAVVAPPNLDALAGYLRHWSGSAGAGMARFIGAGPAAPIYYLLTAAPTASYPPLRFITPGKTLRDVPNLMDSLGTEIDATRDAVFVLDPALADAAHAIRRCYPSATLLHEPSGSRAEPVIALAVPQALIGASRNCTAPPQGPGLRARYFTAPNWDGAPVIDRIEDWPLRFHQDLGRYQSIEWSGSLRIPVTGDYRFQLHGFGDAGEVRLGAIVNVSLNIIGGAHLEAGTYPLTIRCRFNHPDNFCALHWQPPGGGLAVIPPEFLLPP